MNSKPNTKLAALELKTREVAKNTLSALEFVAETIKAESRHFKKVTISKVTERLTGYTHKPQRDVSLEPLAGVVHRE